MFKSFKINNHFTALAIGNKMRFKSWNNSTDELIPFFGFMHRCNNFVIGFINAATNELPWPLDLDTQTIRSLSEGYQAYLWLTQFAAITPDTLRFCYDLGHGREVKQAVEYFGEKRFNEIKKIVSQSTPDKDLLDGISTLITKENAYIFISPLDEALAKNNPQMVSYLEKNKYLHDWHKLTEFTVKTPLAPENSLGEFFKKLGIQVQTEAEGNVVDPYNMSPDQLDSKVKSTSLYSDGKNRLLIDERFLSTDRAILFGNASYNNGQILISAAVLNRKTSDHIVATFTVPEITKLFEIYNLFPKTKNK